MMSKTARIGIVTVCLVTVMALFAWTALAQTAIRPGFNLFSVDQDQEIGKQSALEAERQLPILRDRSIDAYVNAIGKRLAAVAPGAKYADQFKVVNASDINAFALPGGFLYLNRGLIEAAQNEGQLAGVMAQEMAHVALRHGTNQASKAYVGQAGLGLLGGLIGKDDRSTQKTIAAVGGFGMNAVVLRDARLRLNPALVWVDTWSLESVIAEIDEALRAPRSAATDATVLALADEALALYRGPFLPDESEQPGFIGCREQVRARLLRCLARLARRWEDAGQPMLAAECYLRCIDADNLFEAPYRNLMLSYQRAGDVVEARASYERLKTLLAARLKAAPSPETQAVYAGLKARGP